MFPVLMMADKSFNLQCICLKGLESKREEKARTKTQSLQSFFATESNEVAHTNRNLTSRSKSLVCIWQQEVVANTILI